MVTLSMWSWIMWNWFSFKTLWKLDKCQNLVLYQIVYKLLHFQVVEGLQIPQSILAIANMPQCMLMDENIPLHIYNVCNGISSFCFLEIINFMFGYLDCFSNVAKSMWVTVRGVYKLAPLILYLNFEIQQ